MSCPSMAGLLCTAAVETVAPSAEASDHDELAIRAYPRNLRSANSGLHAAQQYKL